MNKVLYKDVCNIPVCDLMEKHNITEGTVTMLQWSLANKIQHKVNHFRNKYGQDFVDILFDEGLVKFLDQI